jgi:uroporphyrin-III C-methyltransferase
MSESSPPPALPSTVSRRVRVNPLAIAVVAAFAVVAWNWYDTHRTLARVQEDVAKRLAEVTGQGQESRLTAKRAEDDAREATAKLALLEARIAESQSQQVALEQLYQELSRGRDEWMLAEIEQTLAIASQQLQLAGNVSGALFALQTADSRLARSDRPQFIPLRRILAKDIERLKAVPNLDIPGLALKLDQVIGGVDGMTLLADGRPQLAPEPAKASDSVWSRVSGLVWGEVRQLVRIQRLDNSDQGLLSPEQSYFLRENLKLRLLSARVALLQRNEVTYKGDVKIARDWLARYFDGRQKSVEAAAATLDALGRSPLSVELPTLAESLAAVRQFKVAGEKGR